MSRRLLTLLCCAAIIGSSSAPSVVRAMRSESLTSTIVIDSQPFAFRTSSVGRFRLELPTDARGATELRIELHRRATSRDSIRLIANGDTNLRTIDQVAVAVSSLMRFGSRGVVIPVDVQLGGTTSALNLPFPGVFPITISALAGARVLASVRTFVSYAAATDSVAAVAASVVLAPEFAPSRGPEGELLVSATTRTSLQHLVDVLSSVEAPVTLQLQPETLDALNDSQNEADSKLLASLRNALQGRTILASTYVPMDPSSAVAAGLDQEFTQQLRLGESTLQRVLPGIRISRAAWIAHEPLTEAGASLLRNLGVTTVVASSPSTTGVNVDKPTTRVAHIALRDGTLMSVYVADPATTDILDDSTRDDVTTGIRLAAELVAERGALVADGASPDSLRLVVSTSTASLPGSTTIAALTTALQSAPGIAVTDFSNGVTPTDSTPTATLADKPVRDLSQIGAALFSVTVDRVAVGSMLPSDSVEPERWDKIIAVLPSSTIGDSDAYVLGLRKLMRAVKLGVTPPAASTFTLGDRKANIRIQLRNTSTSSLKVRVTLSSAKLLFPEPPKIVELAPNASTDVVISVIARSNGRFPVTVRITTPIGGARVTTPIVLTARVNIIAGLGQIISFCALGLLLAWWAVTWRRSRRRQTTTTVEAS